MSNTKNSLDNFERILVLSPHTDDGEFGCGGSISKFVKEGKTIKYVAFSICEESVPSQYPKDILAKEVVSATSKLGIHEEDLEILRYKVRWFSRDRQLILEDLIRIKKEYQPDLVFCPCSYDIHQDHKTIHEEAKRAFKFSSILGYELIWNNFEFSSTCYIKLNEEDLKSKIAAIKSYETQAKRPYSQEEKIKSIVEFRGLQISTQFAEAFEVIRWIIK